MVLRERGVLVCKSECGRCGTPRICVLAFVTLCYVTLCEEICKMLWVGALHAAGHTFAVVLPRGTLVPRPDMFTDHSTPHCPALQAFHRIMTPLFSQNNTVRSFVDWFYYVLDSLIGYLMFTIMALLSFIGIMHVLQMRLLFNETFSEQVCVVPEPEGTC